MEAMVRVALLVFGGLVLLAILLDGIKRNRERAAYMRRVDLDLPPKARLDIFDEAEKRALLSPSQKDLLLMPAEELLAPALELPASPAHSRSYTSVAAAATHTTAVQASEAIDELASNLSLSTEPSHPQILMLSVMARNRGVFSGKSILDAMHSMGLELDSNGVFQRFVNGYRQQGAQFSVVQAVEPGTFDKFTLERLVTPGLSLFMSLPGPQNPMQAFDEMLRAARTLAGRLAGELRNGEREPLSNQGLQEYRERIRAFEAQQEAEAVE